MSCLITIILRLRKVCLSESTTSEGETQIGETQSKLVETVSLPEKETISQLQSNSSSTDFLCAFENE